MRPSSLNYKISLLEAAIAFVQKDKTADQVLDVELEEPISKKMQNFDQLDDALYLINKPIVVIKGPTQNANVVQKQRANNGKGTGDSQWDREEDLIRKKLERNSINLMKNKIAQQNKASGEQASVQPAEEPQGQAQGGLAVQGAPGNQVQLSQN